LFLDFINLVPEVNIIILEDGNTIRADTDGRGGREDAMTHLPNIHRHPDGSIDFDFYRRRASRQRRRTRRLVLRQFLSLIGWPRRRRGAWDAVICCKT